MNKPGEVRQWEFLKVDVRDDLDAERTVEIMEPAGWVPVCLSKNPIVLKRKDGQQFIQQPRRNYYIEHDETVSIGDKAVSGYV